MRISKIVFASSLLAILFSGATASATSLEVDVRPAFGAGGSKSPVLYNAPSNGGGISPAPDTIATGAQQPYGLGFDGDASIGVKIIPFLSIALMGQFRTMSATQPGANDPNGITNVSRSSWGAGPYVHGYLDLPFIPVVPWIGIGVAYLQDTQTYKANFSINGSNVPTSISTVHYGVSLPISVGVIYPFAHFFGVGPSFTYAPTFPVAGCYGVSPNVPNGVGSNFCSNSDSGKAFITASQYGTWTLGLDIRLTVP